MSDMENRIKEMAAHSFGTWNWQKNNPEGYEN